MGRQVRMVPPRWEHPKDSNGRFIPLFDGLEYEKRVQRWDEQNAKWEEGLFEDVVFDHRIHPSDWERRWVSKTSLPDDFSPDLPFSEWDGDRPDRQDYTSIRDEDNPTWYMMYEDTSEGTPLSPAFETKEELAEYLANQNTSVFADICSDSKEYWLNVIGEPSLALPLFTKSEPSMQDAIEAQERLKLLQEKYGEEP